MDTQIKTGTSKFYLFTVVLLMLVLPCSFALIESFIGKEQLSFLNLSGKWFVFWAVGVRLFTAGLKQAMNPSFTAQSIFHITNKESFVIVRELGYANICMGIAGLVSLFIPYWRIVAACVGGLYFGIAGVNHIIKKPVGANEWIALVSDIFIFLIMLIYAIIIFKNPTP